ncbi:hypothetical protein IGI04_030019 [Brassica rapa subsp. trilocularis]|uniref:Transmembrane protein n=1 Tax=Brassica rapa subsp. trilocularis TaxID=1813537 RepID=A0ABQ7LPI2_BRACM|nr:hypothetical protein IGI04_030019 [Brassica rapa subsp. trilocularis]
MDLMVVKGLPASIVDGFSFNGDGVLDANYDQFYEFPVVRLFLMLLYIVLELHLFGFGQSLVVFLVVGLQLIVPARLCFKIWFFSRMVPQFSDFVYSIFLSLFSHLVALFIAGCVSGGSPFHHVCHSRLFLVSNLSSGFSVVGFHSPSLMLRFFFPCFPWYICVELVSWSFDLFYSELCVSSLAWAPCMWLFCLCGDSYLLAGGCALGMCFPAS